VLKNTPQSGRTAFTLQCRGPRRLPPRQPDATAVIFLLLMTVYQYSQQHSNTLSECAKMCKNSGLSQQYPYHGFYANRDQGSGQVAVDRSSRSSRPGFQFLKSGWLLRCASTQVEWKRLRETVSKEAASHCVMKRWKENDGAGRRWVDGPKCFSPDQGLFPGATTTSFRLDNFLLLMGRATAPVWLGERVPHVLVPE
jgi:hypothetical protein